MNYDKLYVVDEIVVDGEQLIVNSDSQAGGSAANTIYALAKLGIKAGFIGVVGTDKEGKFLVSDLKSVNVDTSGIKMKSGCRTGSTVCLADKHGNRAIYIDPGANNKFTYKDISKSFLQSAEILHLSSFVNDEQFFAQVYAIERIIDKPKITFSPGIIYARKGIKGLKPILQKTDTLLINRDEIETLTGESYRKAARVCIQEGCETVVVTLGRGIKTHKSRIICYILKNCDDCFVESVEKAESTEIDSTGAGDAFAAGFILGCLKHQNIYQCGLLGDILAKFVISGVGARSSLPNLQSVSKKYIKLGGTDLKIT